MTGSWNDFNDAQNTSVIPKGVIAKGASPSARAATTAGAGLDRRLCHPQRQRRGLPPASR